MPCGLNGEPSGSPAARIKEEALEQERTTSPDGSLRGLVIPWDPALDLEVRQLGELADYQAAVSGSIEAVDVPDLNVTFYVNEEGLLRRLPFNARATFLWWYHDPVARGISILVGDAVVVGARVDDEIGSDLKAETIAALTEPGDWAIRTRLGIGPTWGAVLPRTLDVVFPIVNGDPRWFVSEACYGSYFDACAWAVMAQAHAGVKEVELIPFRDVPSVLDLDGRLAS